MKKAYLDYAATTPVEPRVLRVMLPYFSKKFGNPSSIHLWGQEARRAVEEAREKIAQLLGCSSREIYFTGTTTTSDNLAIQGVMRAAKKSGRNHLITSAVEHHAVLDTCQALTKESFKLTILPVDKSGQVRTGDLQKALTNKTALVSVMLANNEVGTIQPIKKLAEVIKPPVLFHTDAAAAAEYLEIQPVKLGVDLLTLGAHKFGGPKGVGLLYIRRGIAVEPITYGGHHEAGLWPGTEAVPLIVGMAKALEIAIQEKDVASKQVSKLRDKLIKSILAGIPDTSLTGHPKQRLPDIASFIFEGVEGESVLLALSDLGIAASSGSACTSGILKASHVLKAMGFSPEQAHGSIRFSLGKATTEKEIDYVLSVLPRVINRLRQMAPK